MLEVGILKNFDSGTYKAGVQLAGSLTTYFDDISVAKNIPSSAMVVGNYVILAIPGGNPKDACVIATWPGGSPGGGSKIQDADGDTIWDVEPTADADEIVGKVKGVEVFHLHDTGILTLAKQAAARANRITSRYNCPNQKPMPFILNEEEYDVQDELDLTTKTGIADATEAFKLHDADGGFASSDVGHYVYNTVDDKLAQITAFVDSGELTLDTNIMASGEAYVLYHCRYTAKKAGTYFAEATCHYISLPVGKYADSIIRKIGSSIGFSCTWNQGAGLMNAQINYTTLVQLAIGDYLEPFLYHNGGVVLELYNGFQYGHFIVAKLY